MCRRVVSTGNASVGNVTFARRKSLCVSVATAVTASAAVSAGETIANFGKFCVFLYRKEA